MNERFKTFDYPSCYITKISIMTTKNKEEDKEKSQGTSKEKASFDQNGKGASEKYGQAGETPNESETEKGAGTTNENRK